MTNNESHPGELSRYLEYLPAIFQEATATGQPPVLGRILLAFEQVLTGRGSVAEPGLEEILDGIRDPNDPGNMLLAGVQRYFDPGPYEAERARQQTPGEFLEWLAGWVALTLRGDLDELRQRDFIARAVSLYRLRGTKKGLEQFLGIYTRLGATVDELNTPFQLGVHARVGVDTILDGGAPHFFQVIIRIPSPDPEQIRKQREVATAIIDMEKPAHTHYRLLHKVRSLHVERYATVGVDTLLGDRPIPLSEQEA